MGNHTPPCKQSKVSFILSNEYPSFIVLLFSLHRLIQNLSPPSFFLTSTIALAHGLKLFLIAPTSTISWRWFFTSSYRWGGILWYLSLKGWGSVILMACFRILHLPKSKSFLEKPSADLTKRFLADCCYSALQLSNPSKFRWSKIQEPPFPQVGPCLFYNLEAWSWDTILVCCSWPTTVLDDMVIRFSWNISKTYCHSIGTRFQYAVGGGTLHTGW